MQTSEKQTKKIIKRTHRKILARASEREKEERWKAKQTESKSIEAYPMLD